MAALSARQVDNASGTAPRTRAAIDLLSDLPAEPGCVDLPLDVGAMFSHDNGAAAWPERAGGAAAEEPKPACGSNGSRAPCLPASAKPREGQATVSAPANGSAEGQPQPPKYNVGDTVLCGGVDTGTVASVSSCRGTWVYTIQGDMHDQRHKKRKKTTWGSLENTMELVSAPGTPGGEPLASLPPATAI